MNGQILLSPFGQIYRAAVAVRNKFYQNGFFESHDLGAPVVSVGNLTVGGTGKTPLVAFVARLLANENFKVCVLTRGYKRANPNERVVVSNGAQILTDAAQAGDEPLMLAQKLLHTAMVIADKNRAAAGIWARENLGANAFVLDDGFQHRRVRRDVDIVTVDATNPFGNGRLLPIGILREPLESLRRADAVIITRADLSEKSSDLQTQITRINSHCPVLSARTEIIGVTDLAQFLKFPAKRQSGKEEKDVLAFCGLGNPQSFFDSLRRAGFQVAATLNFPDHHVYAEKDVDFIERAARQKGVEILLTTAKDAVKLKSLKFDLRCRVVEIEPIIENENVLQALIKSKIKGKAV